MAMLCNETDSEIRRRIFRQNMARVLFGIGGTFAIYFAPLLAQSGTFVDRAWGVGLLLLGGGCIGLMLWVESNTTKAVNRLMSRGQCTSLPAWGHRSKKFESMAKRGILYDDLDTDVLGVQVLRWVSLLMGLVMGSVAIFRIGEMWRAQKMSAKTWILSAVIVVYYVVLLERGWTLQTARWKQLRRRICYEPRLDKTGPYTVITKAKQQAA